MSEGMKKNWEVVTKQVRAYREECKVIKRNVAKEHNVWRKLHYASGYLEEAIDLMPRLWFYTWLPKWAFVAWLIWG